MDSYNYVSQDDLSKLVKGAGIVFFGTVFGNAVTYIFNVYIARVL